MREIRLMNEYSVDFPIWDEDGLVDAAGFPVGPQLGAELREWAAIFDAHFDPFEGWDDPAVASLHHARGPALRDRLQTELGPGCHVVLDQWEHRAAAS